MTRRGPSTTLPSANGKCRSELEALAGSLDLPNRCRFLGHVSDVAAVYAQLDVVVIPSLYEGFCFSAVEAALAGVPVVASRAGALREVVLDERTGILVPPKNPGAIADALLRLAREPEFSMQLGRMAHFVASERFQTPALLDELDALLAQAATEDPVGR